MKSSKIAPGFLVLRELGMVGWRPPTLETGTEGKTEDKKCLYVAISENAYIKRLFKKCGYILEEMTI